MLTIDQVRSIQNKLYKNDKPLLDLIVELGYANKKDLLPLYAEAYDIEYIDLSEYQIDIHNASTILGENICRKFAMIALSTADSVLTLGMKDPKNIFAIDSAQLLTSMMVKPVLVDETLLEEKLDILFPPKPEEPEPEPEPEEEVSIESEELSSKGPAKGANYTMPKAENSKPKKPRESKSDTIFRERIGQVLLDAGLINDQQLDMALIEQKENGGMIGNILVAKGFVKKESLYSHLENQIGVEYIELENYEVSEEAIKAIPRKIAIKHSLIPLSIEDNTLTVGMADPLNIFAVDDLRLSTGYDIKVLLADNELITNLLLEYYPKGEEPEEEEEEEIEEEHAANFMEEMERVQEEIEVEVQEVQQVDANVSFNDVENAPIVRMLNMIFKNAVSKGASDIHIEAYEDCVMVRFRIDGKLVEVTKHDKKLHPILVARVKIISGLNIAERRVPQDGRITLKINNKNYDFRVSILPTVFGEKVVIRIADKEDFAKPKSELGFNEDDLVKFNRMLARPNGIVLVTGPTGSGKSTTLYSALRELSKPDVNILTVEDPVEATIRGVNQVQVNTKSGMTFATALRSFLRQDPDIIMVGEIRDGETAEIAIRAAITGHLVLSTLHTNDSVSSINRLIDMDVEPFLIASSLVGVLAQRLVRKLCPICKAEYTPNERQAKILNLEDKEQVLYKPVGCPQCNGSGYKGRTAIYEILEVNDELKELISLNATAGKLYAAAKETGMSTLHSSCTRLVLSGVTSLEEMLNAVAL